MPTQKSLPPGASNEVQSRERVDRRNLVSSFFITLLIGIAYQDAASLASAWLRRSEVGSAPFMENILLLMTFFFVSMRFFVGNQLHFLHMAQATGFVWLYDLMFTIAESVIIIFLGGSSSFDSRMGATAGFLDFLAALYVVDVIWIITQWGTGRLFGRLRRPFVPWGWALLNTGLLLSILVLATQFSDDIYSSTSLWWLFALNFLGFLIDVTLLDHYGALALE